MRDAVARIERLFVEHGSTLYDGFRAESVTALEHALQCAQLAEWAEARPSLVAAAFLHDVGHFVLEVPDHGGIDDAHELRALSLLGASFAAEVTEPIRLHVRAKRFLVATDATYFATLSPASIHSLELQGGPMTRDEAETFAVLPFAADAIALRRWDDLAKEPGRPTPSPGYYLALLEETMRPV